MVNPVMVFWEYFFESLMPELQSTVTSPTQHRGLHAVPVTAVTEGSIAVRGFEPDLGAALGL